MSEVIFVVEGTTEERFVNEILADYLGIKGIWCSARKVGKTSDRRAKGGLTVGFEAIRKDITACLAEASKRDAKVTTMFDLYGLHSDFPGVRGAKGIADAYQKAAHVEAQLSADINNRFFIPYIQLYEFEALLFCSIDKIATQLNLSPRTVAELTAQCQNFESPEHINDSPHTAPSKRLLAAHQPYDKLTDGLQIARAIGLETMRNQCKHFNEWLEKLEALA